MTFSRKSLDFIEREIISCFGIKSQAASAAHDVFRVGALFEGGVQYLHQMGFIDVPAPVAEYGLERTCTARVLCNLPCPRKQTKFVHPNGSLERSLREVVHSIP